MKIIKYITALSSLLLIPSVSIANEVSLKQFSEITLSKGIEAYIKYSDEPRLVLDGAEDVVSSAIIISKKGSLYIENPIEDKSFITKLFSDNILTAIIYTNKPVEKIDAVFGSEVTNEKGTLAQNLSLNGSAGTNFNLKGSIKKLSLTHSMGGNFNKNTYNVFSAENVNISISTGVKVYLCGSQTISGDSTLGSKLYIDKNSSHVKIANNIGSSIEYINCK